LYDRLLFKNTNKKKIIALKSKDETYLDRQEMKLAIQHFKKILQVKDVKIKSLLANMVYGDIENLNIL
jgi:hypothetical protein